MLYSQNIQADEWSKTRMFFTPSWKVDYQEVHDTFASIIKENQSIDFERLWWLCSALSKTLLLLPIFSDLSIYTLFYEKSTKTKK